MLKIAIARFVLGALVALAVPTISAQAQATRTWVSGVGDDINTCSRTQPCQTFAGAMSKTATGGEINCLDGNGFGSVFINKSLTISCEAGTAGIHTATYGITVNDPSGTADVVLRGLDIMAVGGNGSVGINVVSAASVQVENVTISGFRLAGSAGIRDTRSGAAKLTVQNTIIRNNGSVSGGGIVIKPDAGGSARVHLDRVTVVGNAFGIAADGTGSTAGINMTISDSVSSGNGQDGIVAVTQAGGAPIGVMITNTKSTNNNIGIRSIGPNVTVRVDTSAIIGNGTGLSFSGGGALLTYGNNNVDANGTNGAFSGSVGLQ